jgi:hypothetical protein
MDALRWKVLLKWMITEGTPFFFGKPSAILPWQRIMAAAAAQEASVPEDATVSCRHPWRLGDMGYLI